MPASLSVVKKTSKPLWKQERKRSCHGPLPSLFLSPAPSPVLPLTGGSPSSPLPISDPREIPTFPGQPHHPPPLNSFGTSAVYHTIPTGLGILSGNVLVCVSYETPCKPLKDKGHFFCCCYISHSIDGLRDPLYRPASSLTGEVSSAL